MRLLFSIRPYYGHFHPSIPLARAAEARGHEVVFATAAPFLPVVRGAGFPAILAGLHPREVDPPKPGGPGYDRDYGEQPIRAKITDLCEYARDHPFDLIIRDPTDVAAVLVGELLDVPCVTLGFSIYIPSSSWDILLGDRFERLRGELGLPPDPGWARMHPYLYLDVVPPFFEMLAEPLPVWCPISAAVATGAADERGAATTPADGRPVVHVSLGTEYNRRPELLRILIEGAAALPARVIATVGPAVSPSSVWADPPYHVRIEQFLPLAETLRHCDAVISAGGFNTVIGSICAGVPLLVVPLGSDQPRNATRVVELGVGRRLDLAQVDRESVTAELRRLLTDPKYGVRAARCAELNRALPSPEDGVRRLEELLARREPYAAA